ncbi:MAG: HD-GYP domain-containing protein [Caldilinea sp. CFX5]|nr:HD-GYP domain-containing protein [Caldilinea sp. CFX5]
MSVATMIDGVLKRECKTIPWLPVYIAGVSVVGLCTIMLALTFYAGDWRVLLLFAGLAAVAEVANVQLFAKSRSAVSMGFVVAMAAIVVLGPWAGILPHLASGAATIIPKVLLRKQRKRSLKLVLTKATFNMNMDALSAASGGLAYWLAGGIPGAFAWPVIWPLTAAVLADTVVNMSLLITVISLDTKRHPRQIWMEDWQWVMPITLVGGILGGGALAMAYTVAGTMGLMLFAFPVIATGYAFHLYHANLRTYADQLEVANRQLDEANLHLLHTLGAVIDAYDIYTFGHSAQVARYAGAIAEVMKLPVTEQTIIVRGALIHDIGKIGVIDAIVGKQGRLTDEEYAMMKLHTVIGADIVNNMPLLQHLVPLVRSHHERWDGRGYPDGLCGEEAPLAARILAVADSVDAMLSDRPYQATRSLEDVVAEVIRCSGKQYDPTVVTAFLTVVQTHGRDFFVNSAAKVAQELQDSEKLNVAQRMGYAQKSMAHLVKSPIGA